MHAAQHRAVKRRFPYALAAVFMVAAAVRLVALKHPGFEWDEPVYAEVTRNAMHGAPTAKTEYYRTPEPYLYHPPFYFYLLAGWFKVFGAGIVQARVLAALCSLVLLFLVYRLLHPIIGHWSSAVLLLLSVDAWMVFTNRVSWIENSMMPLGVAAILLYYRAIVGEKAGKSFFVAGIAFGVVTTYKHIGLYFFLVPLVAWLLTREKWRQHVMLILGFVTVMSLYIGAMIAAFGRHFWAQFDVQLNRSTGSQASRGTITSISEVIQPITEQYAVYWLTFALMVVAGLLAVIRTGRIIRAKARVSVGEAILLAWVWAALAFFSVLHLKMPHYFMMLQVPFYCYLGLELQRRCSKWRASRTFTVVAASAVCVVLAANTWALTVRMHVSDGNPLAQTAEWMTQNIPLDAKVVTEESVGSIIKQPYCKMVFARYCQDAEYIITYTSATQTVPDSRSVEVMLSGAMPLATFQGFKEEIIVYKIG